MNIFVGGVLQGVFFMSDKVNERKKKFVDFVMNKGKIDGKDFVLIDDDIEMLFFKFQF